MTIHPALREPVLITAGARPASVYYRGGEVRVDIHDEWYLRSRKRMLEDIKALHPDTASAHQDRRSIDSGGTRDTVNGHTYNQAAGVLKHWEAEQKTWYATFDLEPPRHRRERSAEPATTKRKLWRKSETTASYYYTPPIQTSRARAYEAAKVARMGRM